MDIASLQAFVAVAHAASFSGAAQQLHLTQPAVSKRIAALEQALGTALFDRLGRQILLTEAGRALLVRAERILAEVEDSRRAIRNLAGEVAGRFSLGTSHHVGLHRLPPFLRTYSRRFPAVELDLHFLGSEAVCQAVVHGELELGVVTLPLAPSPHLALLPLWRDPLSIVVATDHPLARHRTLHPADLAVHPAVLPEPGTTTRDILEAALEKHRVELRAGSSTNYLETIRMMVEIGLGWGLLPDSMLDATLRPLKVKGLRLERTLGIVRHIERTSSNAALKMIELLHSAKERSS